MNWGGLVLFIAGLMGIGLIVWIKIESDKMAKGGKK